MVAPYNNFELSNGSHVAAGTVVLADYLFYDMANLTFLDPHTPTSRPPSRGPIAKATRTFMVFCDRFSSGVNFKRLITVSMTDSLFDPRTQLTKLRNALQLQQPAVVANPIVATYGGLVTRYPNWMAIEPSAWREQESNIAHYRGADLILVATPRNLDFIVSFTPDRTKPSAAFRGVVGCVPAVAGWADASALPAFPALPDQTEPGVNGPCMWTPPGPGSVTFTARITYSVMFWAGGYTEAEPDYVWSSQPRTFATGELTAVNTNPID